ncbi:hypothetical protein A3K64_04195 [Candidatus Micrarchaeota archaeon RBG_16_36_9]|nr:MAG: hypothetical protein A3K64_04195 [Candidatus Micrarchaeota archaeon RBG_16_36_9]
MKKRKKFFRINNHGQVWIETVIYTLIAFVLIGLVLSFAKPKIEELQDRAIIEQSLSMLKQIDSTILTMGEAGNQRILELGIKKGNLKIDAINDDIIFELESKSIYSEPGQNISDGSVRIFTEKRTGYSLVTLTADYSENYNIEFEGKEEVKILSKASTAYKLSILNEGEDISEKIILNMSIG